MKLSFRPFIPCIILITLVLPARAQNDAMDSIRVKGRSFLILGDSSIYVENDTVFVLPHNIAQKIKRDETARSTEFYRQIKEKLYRKRFTKELYNMLFSGSGTIKKAQPRTNGDYLKYEGRIIQRVIIKKLEALGTDINDTSKIVDSWAINLANDLHVLTRSRIIRNALFFTEGDVVESDDLNDSERVLRDLPYITDARILLIPREDNFVDVMVIVKDVWSISGQAKFNSIRNGDVAIIENNFLGLGHEFKNEVLYNLNEAPKIGYNGTYTVNNIDHTFITGQFNFAHSEPLERIGIRFFKNFITPEIKYAGGLEFSSNRIRMARIYPDTIYTFYSHFNRQDMWFGRSWLIHRHYGSGRINLQIAARYRRLRYLDRPVVEKDTNQLFFDSNLQLYSIGLTRRDYEEGTLIRGYGRTEDIPKGYLLEFTVGTEENEFYSRAYMGWRLSLGNFYRKLGYFRPSLAMGGFVRDGRIEQGAVKLQVDYFSNLYRINRINFRQFFHFDYTTGINRFDYEFVDINNSDGVRGLSDTFLRGTRKIYLKSETIAFTPLYLLGFRFAIFGFADLAMVNARNSNLLKNKLYQGYGIGFRLRNDNLAFKTIQIRFAWYPFTPPDEPGLGASLQGETSMPIEDFTVGQPEIVNFD